MKQILIIGQGGIGKAQLPEPLIPELPDDIKDLLCFRNKEALRRLELEEEIPQKIFQHSKSYRDEEKINSQRAGKQNQSICDNLIILLDNSDLCLGRSKN